METLRDVGKITISRTSHSLGEDYMTLLVSYENRRVEVTMSMEAFAYAITGLGRVECDIREDLL